MFRYFLCIGLVTISLLTHSDPDKGSAHEAAVGVSTLKKEDLFNILAAELYIQRNEYDQALALYQQQLSTKQDRYSAERTAQLAMQQKKYVDMLEAALIWQKLDNKNELAHFFTSLAYGLNMQPYLAIENMRKVLQLHGETDFTRLVNLTPKGDKAEDFYLQELFQASKTYPDNYDIFLAMALLYQRQSQEKLALEYTDRALEKAHGNSAAIEYVIRIYNKYNQHEKAINAYQAAIESNPDDLKLRQNFAQYALQYNLPLAKEQFMFLLSQRPGDDYVLFNLGIIYIEENNLAEAEKTFLALRQSKERLSAANYYLGEIYKMQGDMDKALRAFAAVNDHENKERANEQIIAIYITQSQLAKASSLIDDSIKTSNNKVQIDRLYVLKSTILEKQGYLKEAYQLLTQRLNTDPNSFELRYSRAMLAETKNELGEMESDLRHIIHLYPDSALALNALGYTLADKTNRYREALELIEQAQRLVPDDPAVLDSLGWVLFRMGRTTEAIEYLKHALTLMPDAEVAAHLGEALWASGKKADAKKVLREARESFPDHSVLTETIKRLGAGL